jgi:hypothetical protein
MSASELAVLAYGEIETRLSAETAAAATKRKMRLMKYIRMARLLYFSHWQA